MEDCLDHGGVDAADTDHMLRAHDASIEELLHGGCSQEGRQWGRHITNAQRRHDPTILQRIAWRLTHRNAAR